MDSARVCSSSDGNASAGAITPSCRASSIAWMFASGVRRSWLAQATSSRRASNNRSRLAAIWLNDAASSSISAGPVLGARTVRSPSGQASRSISDGVDGVNDGAAQPEPGEDGNGSRGRRDSEDLHVVAHMEHHPAGQEHGRERKADGECGEPGDLQANGGQRAKGDCQEEADAERRNGDDDGVPDHGTSL